MFDVLSAQAHHCWPFVALGCHTRHMANVSRLHDCLLSLVANRLKITLLCIYRVNELQDPTYQYKVDIVNFEVRPAIEL